MTLDRTGTPAAASWAAKGFVAVDWGSTARRAYLIDPHGSIVDEIEDDAGVLSVPADRLGAEAEALSRRFGDRPVLMAGMIGSNRGLVEVPYVACPADISAVAAGLVWVERDRVAIVPGLSLLSDAHADVMRGEEVQALGLYAMGLAPGRAVICHPGTHTKWIELVDGAVTGFRTIMTGELFGLLKTHSILADLMKNDVNVGPAFLRGVDHARMGGTLGADLFGARARVLLGAADAAETASFISGLLIGGDTGFGLAEYDAGEIIVLGRGSLTRLYAAAIEHRGFRTRQVDGAIALVAGMYAIAGQIT